MRSGALTAVCLLAFQAASQADVTVSGLFGDHMVLQRGMPVPVWGTAAAGEPVTVRFAGQSKTGTAGPDGNWTVALDSLEASAEGRELTIEGKNTVVFKDVLVGEVWICSGQSNMQMGYQVKRGPGLFGWGGPVPELTALLPDARTRPIRSYTVPVNVAFTPTKECEGKWSTDVSGSAVAFGFSYDLQKALDVPVAVIVTCWGSSSIEGWMPLDMTEQLPHFKEVMDAFQSSSNAQARVKAAIARGIRPGYVFVRKQPNLLYNAMMHPVIPYACRGMVWYQGEANATAPEEYAKALPLWIGRLRKEWRRDDLDFLVVMLPGYGKDDGRPDAKSWAWFREAQLTARSLPHVAVANTVDLGEAGNIHPKDKAPVCRRLALLARSEVYGEQVEGQGPTFEGCSVQTGKMTIRFTHAAGLKTTDGTAPKGFWLAGADRTWHPAAAAVDGETVVLSSGDVASPVACRYAFRGKPDVNLVNGANLPAYPFRTDDWPAPTP